jgi:serine/threonine-protein kinase
MSHDLHVQLEASLGGTYTIERELGGGGMSRVFVATDRALNRRVVIKVLSPELAAEVSTKRFAREIRLAASLQQANIVPVLAAGGTRCAIVSRAAARCQPPNASGSCGTWRGRWRTRTNEA